MSTTATIQFRVPNQTGYTGVYIYNRKLGTSSWTSSALLETSPFSGIATQVISGLDLNYIYEFKIQNINGSDNPFSSVGRCAELDVPGVTLSPTNVAIGYSFTDLGGDVDTYRVDLVLTSAPSTVIDSNTYTTPFGGGVSGVFTGLTPATNYSIIVTTSAMEFSRDDQFNTTTLLIATCPDPINVTAVFNP